MSLLTFQLTGATEALAALQAVRLTAVEAAIVEALEAMGQDAANYPPPPANSRYQRTYNLRDGWLESQPMTQMSGTSLLAVLTNPTPYGPFVQGDEQAKIHVGRWRTTEAIMDDWEDRVAGRVEDALDALIQ